MKRILIICSLSCLIFQCKTAQVSSATATLEGTYWKLAEMNGNPVMTAENKKEVHFILTSEGGQNNIKGFAGCNSIAGSYTKAGNKITFTVVSTKMMCEPAQMELEDFLLSALSSANVYSIDGEELDLLDGDVSLAEFKAVYLK